MQLLISGTSPFVRKVRVMLRETNLLAQVEEVAVATTPLASDERVVGANPIGKIPALIRPDGCTIYDSRVITRFLDDYGNTNLYPESCLWDVLTVEATADAMMDAAVMIAYEARFRPENKHSTEWVDVHWDKVSRAVGVLNTRWIDQLSGTLDMGQIAVACALSYFDLRHDARGWRVGHDDLAQWHAAFMQRDSMVVTRAEG